MITAVARGWGGRVGYDTAGQHTITRWTTCSIRTTGIPYKKKALINHQSQITRRQDPTNTHTKTLKIIIVS